MIQLMPPVLLKAYRQSRASYSFHGDYRTWDDAIAASSGYDTEGIADKVRSSVEKVLKGEAAFERDGVAFTDPDYCWGTLSALLWTVSKSGNRLRLLDFGGSLGSTYLQHRKFFNHLETRVWGVVEQQRMVAIGRELHHDSDLTFYESLDEAGDLVQPDTVLCSGVLQYLPQPYRVLESILSLGVRFLIVDRTPFLVEANKERLTVQRISKSIIQSSYPAWFFDRGKFMDRILKSHRLVTEYDSFDRANIASRYVGLVFEKR